MTYNIARLNSLSTGLARGELSWNTAGYQNLYLLKGYGQLLATVGKKMKSQRKMASSTFCNQNGEDEDKSEDDDNDDDDDDYPKLDMRIFFFFFFFCSVTLRGPPLKSETYFFFGRKKREFLRFFEIFRDFWIF